MFGLEFEAQAALAGRGQAGDDADHFDVPSLELRREAVGEPDVRHGKRPAEPDDEGGGDPEGFAPDRAGNDKQSGPNPPGRGKFGLQLQQ